MSRSLNVASILLIVPAAIFVVGGVTMFFDQDISGLSDPGLLEVSVSEIRDLSPELVDAIQLNNQIKGLFFLTLALFWLGITLVPYRKGEKWAWYAMLVIGGILLSGWLILTYIGVTLGIYAGFWIALGIIWFILWGAGLALPVKEILGKPSS